MRPYFLPELSPYPLCDPSLDASLLDCAEVMEMAGGGSMGLLVWLYFVLTPPIVMAHLWVLRAAPLASSPQMPRSCVPGEAGVAAATWSSGSACIWRRWGGGVSCSWSDRGALQTLQKESHQGAEAEARRQSWRILGGRIKEHIQCPYSSLLPHTAEGGGHQIEQAPFGVQAFSVSRNPTSSFKPSLSPQSGLDSGLSFPCLLLANVSTPP